MNVCRFARAVSKGTRDVCTTVLRKGCISLVGIQGGVSNTAGLLKAMYTTKTRAMSDTIVDHWLVSPRMDRYLIPGLHFEGGLF